MNVKSFLKTHAPEIVIISTMMATAAVTYFASQEGLKSALNGYTVHVKLHPGETIVNAAEKCEI